MKTVIKEVKSRLKIMEKKEVAEKLASYLKTNYACLGLSVPQMRKFVVQGYSFYTNSPESILTTWTRVIQNATYFEEISQALLYYQYRKDDLSLKHFRTFKKWIPFIDNWEHSDRMSDLLAVLHEKFPKQVYAEYVKWNKQKNPWFRRQSIVGLFYYSSMRKLYPSFAKAIKLVDALIPDSDLYVQKGVGWTLRELYNVYPEKTYAYLVEKAKVIPPAAWQASTEKLSKKDKAQLMKIRKTK